MDFLTATLVKKFDMLPHPEGGWYKETYRSAETIDKGSLPRRFSGNRAFATAIYFLLEKDNFSAFHRIKSDECWHFYAGDPLQIFVINRDGSLQTTELGNDLSKNQQFQFVVPANCWFASRPSPGSNYSFVGCTVSPGFDFADFELANKSLLSEMSPEHKDLINSLCR